MDSERIEIVVYHKNDFTDEYFAMTDLGKYWSIIAKFDSLELAKKYCDVLNKEGEK